MKASLLSLDAATYQSHALHRGERAWLETNCYVDLWIEVLSAYGLDPHACLAFTLSSDFEGDQWLFFKPPARALWELYGVDVQELNIWRPLLDHLGEQLERGRLALVEVDAFYLPDTAGVSYRSAHTKTTIAVESLDREARRLGYFHNAGYFALQADDFDALFEPRPHALVPYTEFARVERARALSGKALIERARAQLREHVERAPIDNPVTRFGERFLLDLAWLTSQPAATFHAYAFATLRQCGACFELAASYLRWLGAHGTEGLGDAVTAFDNLAGQAKAVQFKAARAALMKRPVDLAPALREMEQSWRTGMDCLQSAAGS